MNYLFDNAVLDRHAQQASGRPVETPEEFADRLYWLLSYPDATVDSDAHLLDSFLDRKRVYSRGEAGGVRLGLLLIVTCLVGFAWGWTHSSMSPNGATVLAVLILASTIGIFWAFGHFYRRADRRADRRAAAYTARVEQRLRQDTTGDHIWDA